MSNKVVIITGCSSGIGLSTAKKYKDEGYTVIGLDISQCPISDIITFYKCDLSNEKEIVHTINNIKRLYQSVNYLICSAGIFFDKQRSFLDNMDINEWTNTIQCNLTGSMLIFRETFQLIQKAKGDKAVLFVSSDQAQHPRCKNSAYAVSKGGLITLAKVCAAESINYGIRVNAIEPASVRTNFINRLFETEEQKESIYEKENDKMPLGLIEPDDVAELIIFLCSEKAKRITEQSISIDGGLYI